MNTRNKRITGQGNVRKRKDNKLKHYFEERQEKMKIRKQYKKKESL